MLQFLKTFVSELAAANPARLIGTVISVISGVSAFIVTLQPALSKVNGWGQAVIVIAAAVIPFIQARYTTKLVSFSVKKRSNAKGVN